MSVATRRCWALHSGRVGLQWMVSAACLAIISRERLKRGGKPYFAALNGIGNSPRLRGQAAAPSRILKEMLTSCSSPQVLISPLQAWRLSTGILTPFLCYLFQESLLRPQESSHYKIPCCIPPPLIPLAPFLGHHLEPGHASVHWVSTQRAQLCASSSIASVKHRSGGWETPWLDNKAREGR